MPPPVQARKWPKGHAFKKRMCQARSQSDGGGSGSGSGSGGGATASISAVARIKARFLLPAIRTGATAKPIIHCVRGVARRRLATCLCHAILLPHRISFLGVRFFFVLPRGKSGQFDRIGFPSSL